MKEARETVGTAVHLVSFGEAIEALKQGKRVQRAGWNGKGLFVFEQVPSMVSIDIIPKMTSLPQSVKDEFIRRFEERQENPSELNSIKYSNQLALVNPDNTIQGWAPSTSDALSNDWIVLD